MITTTGFAVLLLLVFAFSFYKKDERLVSLIVPGILWVSLLFSATLTMGRVFAVEKESGCLRALAMIPGTARSLFVGKLVVTLGMMTALETVIVPLTLLAFDAPINGDRLGWLMFSLAAGTIGVASLGTLVSAMLVHHRLRDVLTPLVLYPLLVPILIAGTKSTSFALADTPRFDSAWSWIQLMLGADVLFVLGGQALFGWVLEAIE